METFSHHIPDKILKSLFNNSKKFPNKSIFPDYFEKKDSKIFCLEYENSSRGMIVHVSKYQKFAENNKDLEIIVLIIESLNHSKKHCQDRELAMFQAKRFPPNNLKIIFEKCDGTLENIIEMVENRKGFDNIIIKPF